MRIAILLSGVVALAVATAATETRSSPRADAWQGLPAPLVERIHKNRAGLAPVPERDAWMAKLPADIVALPNQAYARPAGFDPRWTSLDAFHLRAAHQAPIVIFVHGGGMSAGDKSPAVLVENKARYFPRHGFVFVSTNYRLAPEARHPLATQDLAAAVRFVRNHAAEWGGDPDQLLLIGHSAGAQLAVQLVTDDSFLRAAGVPRAAVRGVISVDAQLYDLPFALAQAGDDGLARAIVEMTYGSSAVAQSAASPMQQLRAGSRPPPMLLFRANDPKSLSYLAAERFAERLRAIGAAVETVGAREKDHSHLGRDIGNEHDWITTAVMGFLTARSRRHSLGIDGRD